MRLASPTRPGRNSTFTRLPNMVLTPFRRSCWLNRSVQVIERGWSFFSASPPWPPRSRKDRTSTRDSSTQSPGEVASEGSSSFFESASVTTLVFPRTTRPMMMDQAMENATLSASPGQRRPQSRSRRNALSYRSGEMHPGGVCSRTSRRDPKFDSRITYASVTPVKKGLEFH